MNFLMNEIRGLLYLVNVQFNISLIIASFGEFGIFLRTFFVKYNTWYLSHSCKSLEIYTLVNTLLNYSNRHFETEYMML